MSQNKSALKFYHYNQNNSGGSFDDDDSVSYNVFIQAHSAKEADELAQSKAGIYFDGVDEGSDCECCGDRWFSRDTSWGESNASEEPSIYGVKLSKVKARMFPETSIIYYYDGRKEKIEILPK